MHACNSSNFLFHWSFTYHVDNTSTKIYEIIFKVQNVRKFNLFIPLKVSTNNIPH